MRLFSHVKGDLLGALSAAIIMFPTAMAFGIIAFAPMGDEFISRGAMAGLYSAIFCCFWAALLGGSPLVISGPTAPLSLLLASFVGTLLTSPHIQQATGSHDLVILSLVSGCVLIGGVFQALFGSLRLGNVIKFIPYPIVAGFTNGIALLLILSQIKAFLGIRQPVTLLGILNHPSSLVQPLTLVVGLFTLAVLFFSGRVLKTVPGPLLGLAGGTALYYLLAAFADPASLGPVVGSIGNNWPQPDFFLRLFNPEGLEHLWVFVPNLVATGLVLGLVGSLLSLLTAVSLDNLSGTRHNSNRELLGQGIGNIVSSFFGGISGAGTMARSTASYKAGGRTPLSGMICGALQLVIVVTLGTLVGRFPLVIFAAILIATGIYMFDTWTINLLRQLQKSFRQEGFRIFRQQKEAWIDFFVVLVVTLVIISINLILAVGIGITIASVVFIWKMGKSIIKREYYGDGSHSKKMRKADSVELLEKEGRQIVVFELEGPLFFGSAENLARKIEITMTEATYCILDMKRVNEIDSTGANIIFQMYKNISHNGKYLLISYMRENLSLGGFLKIMDVAKIIHEEHFFPDTDLALEWAEEHLLAHLPHAAGAEAEISLSQMEITAGFTAEELDFFQGKLTQRAFKKGELIIRQGGSNRDLYLLMKGTASVKLRLSQNDHQKRLFTFSPGVIFGEMGLLDGKPRSADVFAEEDSEVLILPYGESVTLHEERPQIVIKLMMNIGKTISRNLRVSNKELRAFEES